MGVQHGRGLDRLFSCSMTPIGYVEAKVDLAGGEYKNAPAYTLEIFKLAFGCWPLFCKINKTAKNVDIDDRNE